MITFHRLKRKARWVADSLQDRNLMGIKRYNQSGNHMESRIGTCSQWFPSRRSAKCVLVWTKIGTGSGWYDAFPALSQSRQTTRVRVGCKSINRPNIARIRILAQLQQPYPTACRLIYKVRELRKDGTRSRSRFGFNYKCLWRKT